MVRKALKLASAQEVHRLHKHVNLFLQSFVCCAEVSSAENNLSNATIYRLK